MSNLSIFNFHNSNVRVQIINNEPLFCLTDVTSVLKVKNAHASRFNFNLSGIHKMYTPTYNQYGAQVNQEITFINEPNLYRVIFRSNKKEAVDFQNWVFNEVLPAIRKTGNYSLTLNTEQQHLVKAAVLANVARTGKTYQSVYRELYNKFKVPKCQDILAKDFDKAMKFLAVTTQNKIYILDIPFDLRRDCDYYVRVRDGKARRASIAYAMLSEDQGKPWQAL